MSIQTFEDGESAQVVRGKINQNFTTLDSEVNALQSDVSTLNTSVDSVDSSITTINTNITSLNSDVTQLETDVTAIEAEILTLSSALLPQGNWDAAANAPDLSAVSLTGSYWIVSVSGSTDLDSITDWKVNDWAVKTSTGWAKVDNSQAAILVVDIADFSTGVESEISSNFSIASNVAARHTHSNKALLDTYDQTNANIQSSISHGSLTSNPHSVTQSQVGLGNVDNTSDANKPVSTATSILVTSHTSLANNPHSVSASQVGLGNVDNTSDASKPISTATTTALDALTDSKANRANVLELDNTSTFTPSGDYSPATKKYVDDSSTPPAGANGQLQFNTSSTFAASSNLTWDAGNNKLITQDLQLNGGVYLGGSSSSNYLEHYEEGTFTPSITSHIGTSPTITYSSRIGSYVRIGKFVHITMNIGMSGYSGGGSSIMALVGLPFSISESSTGSVVGHAVTYARAGSLSAPAYRLGSDRIGFLTSNNGGSWAWETTSIFSASSHIVVTFNYITT